MAREDYSIIMLKPDGNSKVFFCFLQRYLSQINVSILYSHEATLTDIEVDEMFPTNKDHDLYKEYLTQGPCKFLLVRGERAYDILTEHKYDIRYSFNVKKTDMRNLLHTPEAGNEYTILLKTFFPDIDCSEYALGYDAYAKTVFDNEQDLLDVIEHNSKSTNANLIYVFEPEQIETIDPSLFYAISGKTNDYSIYGIEYPVEVDGRYITLIGYYRGLDTDKYSARNNVIYDNIQDLSHKIGELEGVACVGFLEESLFTDTAFFRFVKDSGIQNVLCYHPNYSIKETVIIRRMLLENSMGFLGGSAGKANFGEYGISSGILVNALGNLVVCDR